jgi:hypothetical protein
VAAFAADTAVAVLLKSKDLNLTALLIMEFYEFFKLKNCTEIICFFDLQIFQNVFLFFLLLHVYKRILLVFVHI